MSYGLALLADAPWVMTEKLPFGGQLQITPDGWQIHYQITEPRSDPRFPKRQDLFVHATRVNELYQAWIKAFTSYEKIRSSVPSGSVMTIPGECNLVIRLGTSPEGVSFSAERAIGTRTALKDLLLSYEYAARRATAVMQAISPLESLQLPRWGSQ